MFSSALRVTRGRLLPRLSLAPSYLAHKQFYCTAKKETLLNEDKIRERLLQLLKQEVDPSKVTPTAHFQNDLGMDNRATVNLIFNFENDFSAEVTASEVSDIHNVNEAVAFVKRKTIKAPPFEKGIKSFKNKNFEDAVKFFTQAIGDSTASAARPIFLNRSMAYIRLEKYEEALQDAERAISLEPDQNSYWRQGLALCGLKKYSKAIDAFATAKTYLDRKDSYGSLLQKFLDYAIQLQKGETPPTPSMDPYSLVYSDDK